MDATTDIYYSTLDLFPQQVPEHNKLHRFFAHLREGRLTTTKCEACGHISWPPRSVCPECASDRLTWIELPSRGTVDEFTISYAGHPVQFGPQIILARVALEGGPTILSRLVNTPAEEVENSCSVELVVYPIDRDRVWYAFQKRA